MRVLRRFPKLEPALRDGRLCLSTASLVGQVLTDDNLEELIERAAFRTKAEVEHLVVSVRPREVWKRDGGRCAWKGDDGRRCDSRWQLEVDHVRPLRLGGTLSIGNLRLLCRAHNMLHAEQVYGREHMDRFRRGGLTIAGDSSSTDQVCAPACSSSGSIVTS